MPYPDRPVSTFFQPGHNAAEPSLVTGKIEHAQRVPRIKSIAELVVIVRLVHVRGVQHDFRISFGLPGEAVLRKRHQRPAFFEAKIRFIPIISVQKTVVAPQDNERLRKQALVHVVHPALRQVQHHAALGQQRIPISDELCKGILEIQSANTCGTRFGPGDMRDKEMNLDRGASVDGNRKSEDPFPRRAFPLPRPVGIKHDFSRPITDNAHRLLVGVARQYRIEIEGIGRPSVLNVASIVCRHPPAQDD